MFQIVKSINLISMKVNPKVSLLAQEDTSCLDIQHGRAGRGWGKNNDEEDNLHTG